MFWWHGLQPDHKSQAQGWPTFFKELIEIDSHLMLLFIPACSASLWWGHRAAQLSFIVGRLARPVQPAVVFASQRFAG
ncbi:hypothetical protein DZC30_19805 [Comamonas testosteroni]|uniref:Uncharacterized protein n=1 Tax=Comamonas testosteroni TaxID=285 RepID=A0A373F9E0_COMTE|nr:hypothetical protein DZC30_19805 [Comamonas testosteroni]